MVTSRTLAYQILLHLEKDASHPDRLIRTVLERHSRLDERDRALMTELVYGVVRWRQRLDWHIDQLSRTRPDRIARPVRILLRLALYQMLFLDRLPGHAAVNEAVNIAKTSQPPHVIRFINGILREASRRGGEWNWPSPAEDLAACLSITTSHPVWFVRRLIDQIGAEGAREFCEADNRIAPTVFRVNTLTSDTKRVLESLRETGINAAPSPLLEDSVRVLALRQDITRTDAYKEGLIQPQDEASQLISHLLAPRPGERVLDLCAGFGVKSTHLAILMRNEGEVVSVDRCEWKLEELRKNAERQKIAIIRPLAADILQLQPEETGCFDRVLLDAPCTGFGAMRRNPDIRWRRHIKDPYRMSQLQRELLARAVGFLKAGGSLVYATCTIFTDENELVAQHLTETAARLRVEPVSAFLPECCKELAEGPYFRSWPHRHDVDGFFAARWRKDL